MTPETSDLIRRAEKVLEESLRIHEGIRLARVWRRALGDSRAIMETQLRRAWEDSRHREGAS